MSATRTVTAPILDVLSRSTFDGNRLVLPAALDRKVYVTVDKVLNKVGGKWNRRAAGHLFPGDASEAVEPVLLTGTVADVTKQFDVFYTPPEIAQQVIDLADIKPGHIALEPSAGMGALALPAARVGAEVTAYELRDLSWAEHGLEPDLIDELHFQEGPVDTGHVVLRTATDFLTVTGDRIYDRVVMNPPFSNQSDMAHVRHAADFGAPAGRLVAILSPAFQFRTTPIARQFREWLDAHDHTVTDLPDGAFKPAGTGVRTVLLAVDL